MLRPMAKIKKTGRHTSAVKAVRQARGRWLRNRSVRRRIRALAKSFTEAAVRKDVAAVQKLSGEVSSAWDKAAKTGAIHWKAAARKKSNLARLSRKALAAAPAVPVASGG